MFEVQPVAIFSALFWTVWSFCKFDSEIKGDQTVQAYSRVGLTIVLNVLIIVSFCLPQQTVVSDFIIFKELFALVLTFFVCSLKVNLGSNVTPRILGLVIVVMSVFPIVRFNF